MMKKKIVLIYLNTLEMLTSLSSTGKSKGSNMIDNSTSAKDEELNALIMFAGLNPTMEFSSLCVATSNSMLVVLEETKKVTIFSEFVIKFSLANISVTFLAE